MGIARTVEETSSIPDRVLVSMTCGRRLTTAVIESHDNLEAHLKIRLRSSVILYHRGI